METQAEGNSQRGTTLRAIISAGREHPKWNNYLGVPQHLVPIFGTPLLRRTVIQVLRRTNDIHLRLPTGELGDRYKDALGANLSDVTVHQSDDEGLCEYTVNRSLWDENGTTVLLLGDVCFSTNAMEIIFKTSKLVRRDDYRCFGRYKGSRITGYRAGEIWAASWGSDTHATMDRHLKYVHDVRASGAVTRPPGWMLLRMWQGTPLNRHYCTKPWFVQIDDTTEDFDFPEKWDAHPMNRSSR